MIQEDGIEVYLKPCVPDYSGRRFRDIPEDKHEDDGRPHVRRVVLKMRNKWNVIVKFSDSFDMASAPSTTTTLRTPSNASEPGETLPKQCRSCKGFGTPPLGKRFTCQLVALQDRPEMRREKRLEDKLIHKQQELRKIQLAEDFEQLQRQLEMERERKLRAMIGTEIRFIELA